MTLSFESKLTGFLRTKIRQKSTDTFPDVVTFFEFSTPIHDESEGGKGDVAPAPLCTTLTLLLQ